MTQVLLKLGDFKFSIKTAALDKLKRTREYTWAATARPGARPALQFTGHGVESIALNGVIYPHEYGERDFIDKLAVKAAEGKPMILVAGTGDVLGYWVVTKVDDGHSRLFQNGVARKIEFGLSLNYYGETDAVSN